MVPTEPWLGTGCWMRTFPAGHVDATLATVGAATGTGTASGTGAGIGYATAYGLLDDRVAHASGRLSKRHRSAGVPWPRRPDIGRPI
jgi:hypothetical protein